MGDLPRITWSVSGRARLGARELDLFTVPYWDKWPGPPHRLFCPMPVSREWIRLRAVGASSAGVALTREEGHPDLQGALGSQSGLVLLRALCRDRIHPSIHASIKYLTNAYCMPGASVTKQERILVFVKTILGSGANNKFYSVLEGDKAVHNNIE